MDKELIINDEDTHDGRETGSTDEIGIDDPSSNEGSSDNVVQVEEPKVDFYEVAEMAIHSERKFKIVIEYVQELKKKLNFDESFPNSIEPSKIMRATSPPKKILSPISIKSKGRPPTKRKESKVDQAVKKLIKKKKNPKTTDDSKKCQVSSNLCGNACINQNQPIHQMQVQVIIFLTW
ncbi:hypothetical protein Tsubulata_007724 [Turnera subulata]|uniref:Uncharacterized protein n=1 Tax=Turnera subulata TaxID=218843 RepID=A0A9Q0F851_9ROSI|nr:hypothetical protein Tsubulata_007724 [Turnera subulata]